MALLDQNLAVPRALKAKDKYPKTGVSDTPENTTKDTKIHALLIDLAAVLSSIASLVTIVTLEKTELGGLHPLSSENVEKDATIEISINELHQKIIYTVALTSLLPKWSTTH